MKVLNLYAGIGGNRKLWTGVDVTAVEMDEKIASVYADQFPTDKLIVGDAHKYLLKHFSEFDFIWSSPPCQTHSKMAKATRHSLKRYPDMSLYQQIIFLKHFFKGKYVVENVKPFYQPLVRPTAEVGRHLFWSNFILPPFDMPHFKNFIMSGTSEKTQHMKDWLGIHYEGNIYYKNNHCPGQVLRNCVHPDIGLVILNAARNTIVEHKQIGLFA